MMFISRSPGFFLLSLSLSLSLLSCVAKQNEETMNQHSTDEFVNSLLYPPAPESSPDPLKLFRPLIGDWEWTGTDYLDDGRKLQTRGQWNFREVLYGNAIQDVFIFEDPGNNSQHHSFAEYGTTVRFPIDNGSIWRAVFVGPMNNIIRLLDATLIGNEIVHEGTNDKGHRIHWIFSNISEESFHWRGEYSSDGGKTWNLYEELEARKK